MATCPKCRTTYPDASTVCPSDGEGLLPDEAFAAADADLAVGEQVGEYVVESKLGEGGFGAVFKATHPLIGKQVAIKVLHRQYSANPQMVSRFISEARAVNQIRHRNIIDIFSFGQLSDGRHYYVMELLSGAPLDRYLAARGRLPLAHALPILRGVAKALDAAHAKGIAHRDLKPENIFVSLDEDGQPFPKLLDFGIAKLLSSDAPHAHKTRTGAPMGTPYYMSPEQCRGRDVDHRTDIYSFGILAYQLLTGQLPFTGQDFMEILLKQLTEAAIPASQLCPELPASVDQGIQWMMEKDPEKRPPNLASGVRALEGEMPGSAITLATSPGAARITPPNDTMRASTPVPGRTPAGRTPGHLTPAEAASLASAQTISAEQLPAAPNQSFIAAEASAAPAARKGRAGLVVGLAVVLVAGGAGAIVLTRGKGEGDGGGARAGAAAASPASTAGSPAGASPTPTPAPSPSPAMASSPPSPLPPVTVTLDVQGTPEGTEVRDAATGKVLGVAPGTFTLPRGDAPVTLEFRKKGYKTRTLEVTPDRDGLLGVTLEPERRRPDGSTSKKPKKPGRDDLEDFGD